MAEYELTINDVTIEDFFLVLAREFAAVIAEEQEIADEERADFEESFVDGFMLDLDADVFEEGLVKSLAPPQNLWVKGPASADGHRGSRG